LLLYIQCTIDSTIDSTINITIYTTCTIYSTIYTAVASDQRPGRRAAIHLGLCVYLVAVRCTVWLTQAHSIAASTTSLTPCSSLIEEPAVLLCSYMYTNTEHPSL
jgi:sugar phosphate permease